MTTQRNRGTHRVVEITWDGTQRVVASCDCSEVATITADALGRTLASREPRPGFSGGGARAFVVEHARGLRAGEVVGEATWSGFGCYVPPRYGG